MARTVAVLGGGVAGMTAAHELVERGFDVTVFETAAEPGGKARSMPVPGTGEDGRPDLPGEHGFRFFPGFYRHLPDTMRRIPVAHGGATAFGRLVAAEEIQIARAGRRELLAPARFPQSADDLLDALRFLYRYATESGVSGPELAFFANRLFLLLASCDERRFGEYERLSWWAFSGAADRSEAYQLFLADGLTRSLVAARARELSARTGGLILLQLLFDVSRAGGHVDRVLDGPTNEVWIGPWLAELRARGVDYRTRHDVQAIRCAGDRVTSVLVASADGHEEVAADHYVAALPVEQLQMLADRPLRRADPALAGVRRLETRWMNGIMFYVDRPLRIVRGHTLYLDSEWSLTSIAQQQFWKTDLRAYGDGSVRDVLSVDVSEWRRAGRNGKIAMKCTREEIREEVWRQLVAHLNDDETRELDEARIVTWFLDPAIRFPNPIEATNLEPLLINTPGSWSSRPEAVPADRRRTHGRALGNLFLAGDYVRTHTDLATMEGANEAARRAVNGILAEAAPHARRCMVLPLDEPDLFAPARAVDRLLYRLGRPPRPVLRLAPDGRLKPAGRVGSALLRAGALVGRG